MMTKSSPEPVQDRNAAESQSSFSAAVGAARSEEPNDIVTQWAQAWVEQFRVNADDQEAKPRTLETKIDRLAIIA